MREMQLSTSYWMHDILGLCTTKHGTAKWSVVPKLRIKPMQYCSTARLTHLHLNPAWILCNLESIDIYSTPRLASGHARKDRLLKRVILMSCNNFISFMKSLRIHVKTALSSTFFLKYKSNIAAEFLRPIWAPETQRRALDLQVDMCSTRHTLSNYLATCCVFEDSLNLCFSCTSSDHEWAAISL